MAPGWLTGMKQYESAFLGLILAGVVMMIVGVGLMISSARSSDNNTALAQQLAARSPPHEAGLSQPQPIDQ